MRPFILLLCGAASLAACAGEPATQPVQPTESAPTPDLRPQAFRLELDLDAGRVAVHRPGAANATNASGIRGPSLSLLGGEAVTAYSLNGITCVQISKNPNVKRCTFDLQVQNRLASTDFMTPTDFPRPPQGTSGVLVFPFSATSDGTGAWATPSADWDRGPMNFFNDAASCSSGGKSDCYRYTVIPSPLYGGDTYEIPKVGFDVPGDAKNVTAYVVVAADLRENPLQRAEYSAEETLCGYATSSGKVLVDSYYIELAVRNDRDPDYAGYRGFCSFRNVLPQGARIAKAYLRLFPITGSFLAEPLDYGTTLDASDYWLPSPPANESAKSFCCMDDRMYADVTTSVQKAADLKPQYIQYRLMPDNYPLDYFVVYAGTGQSQHVPKLLVYYRWR